MCPTLFWLLALLNTTIFLQPRLAHSGVTMVTMSWLQGSILACDSALKQGTLVM